MALIGWCVGSEMRVGVILREQHKHGKVAHTTKKVCPIGSVLLVCGHTGCHGHTKAKHVLVAFHSHPSQRKREKQSSERPSHEI